MGARRLSGGSAGFSQNRIFSSFLGNWAPAEVHVFVHDSSYVYARSRLTLGIDKVGGSMHEERVLLCKGAASLLLPHQPDSTSKYTYILERYTYQTRLQGRGRG